MIVCAKGGNVGGSSYACRQPQEVSMIFYVCAPGPTANPPQNLLHPWATNTTRHNQRG